MKYIEFPQDRPIDLIALGRIAVDFNPIDYNRPLEDSVEFRKYVGGSPSNIAIGLARLGKKVGFIGKISDDQMGTFVENTFKAEGIDTSQVVRATGGEKIGLTFTEILSETESSILMYRKEVADLKLDVDEVDEEYIKKAKAIEISGTALSEPPSREAALKAMFLALKHGTKVIFDIDYRAYSWKNEDEIAIYYSIVASHSDVILGSREEFDKAERLIAQGMNDRQSADYWLGQGASVVVIKHGKKGSTAYTKDGESYSIKPFPVKALKGFGGGDGYAAAFLHGLFEGMDMIDCLEMGSAEAAMLVASHACSADMPTLEELREFIAHEKAEYGEMVARV